MVSDLLHEANSSSANQGLSSPGYSGVKIPEMGSVVATITGYIGDERSNLIKLINSSGGYYVGKLSKGSITHLVCWTFDGQKYEMAKKFGICIINHQWFEDCFKAGRRLSEGPYTILSGKDVGAVLWKAPKQETSSLQHAKLGRSDTCAKYVCNKPKSAMAEGFCEAVALRRTVSEEILNLSEDDQDLQILLDNKPTKRDKGKRKASLVLKNQSRKYKTPKKGVRKSTVSPVHAGQRKHGDTRNKISHSILDYVYLTDEIDVDNNQSSPILARKNLKFGIPVEHLSPEAWLSRRNPTTFSQLEEIEDCSPSPSTRTASSRKGNHKSLSIFDSMRHRKKRRLVRKTEALNSACGFSDVVSGTTDMSYPQSSIRASPRTEIYNDEPSASKLPCCPDAAHFMAFENLSKSPVACTFAPADIACVICHTDHINSAEGILSCGHHFCYQCIKKWASEVASKEPTCPLCKAPFDMITKKEPKVGLDDEEMSYEESVVLLGFGEKCSSEQLGDSTPTPSCIMCGIGDMEELLLTCTGCGTRSAHSFCLDPPLPPVPNTPWFCGRCSQRRRADATWWYQLHPFEGAQD